MTKRAGGRLFWDRLAADYSVNAGPSLDRLRALVLLTEYRCEQAVFEWYTGRPNPISTAVWMVIRFAGSVFQWLWANANIPGSAAIGPGLRLPHPQNIIVGSGSRLGARCIVYQNVTIAGNNRRRFIPRPRLGDDVIVGTGVIVIGDVEVGSSTILAAGSTVAKSVPPGSVLTPAPPVIRPRTDMGEAPDTPRASSS